MQQPTAPWIAVEKCTPGSSRGVAAAIPPACHYPWSHGSPGVPDLVQQQLSVSPLQMTHLGQVHISFGTEPRLSYQAPKSTRINKPNSSSWLQPQGSAGGA